MLLAIDKLIVFCVIMIRVSCKAKALVFMMGRINFIFVELFMLCLCYEIEHRYKKSAAALPGDPNKRGPLTPTSIIA